MSDWTEWTNCSERLPVTYSTEVGELSDVVWVMLSSGKITKDWLVNGQWARNKHNSDGQPIKWCPRGKQ